MSGTNPVFLVRKAKKSSGQKDAVLWCSDDFEAANATLDYLLIKSGAKLKDYFKAVATNFPVVNELPPEGELSLTFCDFYQLGKDNMTWAQIPGVTLPSSDAAAEARQHIVNGVDTETGEVLEDHTEDFGNEEVVDTETGEITQHEQPLTEDNGDRPEHPQLTVVATMPFRHRVLAQHIGDGEYLYHVDAEQKKAILALEMDTDNSYVQNLLLASENVEPFKKAIEHDIHKAVNAVKNVFPADGKIPELASVIQFLKTWFDTPHIDRGLLVKEWCKGNRVSAIQRTESGANAGGGIASDRKMPQTTLGLEFEIALGLLARQYEFDIYSLPLQIELKANSIMNAVDDPEWLATRELFVSIPGGLDYSRACIVATVKTTPDELYKSPFRHREYLNKVLTETDHANPDPLVVDIACGRSSMPMPTPVRQDEPSVEEVNRQLAAARGDYVEGISDPNDPKWVHEDYNAASNEGEKTENEDAADVQVQETDGNEEQAGDALRTSESDLGNGEEADTGEQADVDHNQPEVSQNNDSASHSEPEAQQEEPMPVWPEYFEPGRYEGVPNEVYHAANGTSSTMVKDARVSLMYFEARHVSKTIQKERTKVLDMGNLVHALALQPEQLEKEFSIEPEIPEGALTTTATIRAVIDEHNASLPALLTADDIKALLEEYNTTLPAPLPLGASVDEAYASYEQLPEEFQRIENGTKHTATAMKACIKEYNATLPPQVKTSGSRDALLEQLTIINPDLVAQEAQKPQPLKVSGTKADLIQAVKTVKPETVFADELLDAWRENPSDKILVTRQQLSTAQAIQKALLNHPTAGKLLTHPNRAVEVSYFGIDEETGLEIRVRPDLEIDMGGLRIGADLKTISMWNIKQEGLRAKLHREIIERDYHLSAAMYCETAALDQFFWIFVNKDENYHWIAIIEASEELLELGMLEYRKAMRAIANGFDTGEWPAPITEDYAEELNDFDVRRLEALRVQA
ncbi:RecE family exodeoxyribonuclease [Citrobacter koseri]|uniref:RecE family exodeoxyribonuclease n=1 Tax=Citrobacter koseri TaxID=545 RepID=UPI0019071997|nr:RecE family exodeoxyribonuclease [Citrobacter koseri]MBJ8865274.1 PD-(D/E)XK nuclease-like domain-containing protein [Citrobacter koseri]MBL4565022.1 PD-(D/E)XK nuclease-like domain-containing protein [Citrobacter koseri]